ncbi:MAG TPA: prolyl oligopeptidase family serine peptidase [Phycisphaerales bacterium]|nr:prolyl oligopeptidase family serine peptidase [Phycisphaerales bacterium]
MSTVSHPRRLLSLLAALAVSTPVLAQHPHAYPPAERDESVVDTYHGVKVPDPYRWLEDPDTARAREWITAQNQLTEGYLAKVPEREAIKRRLTELWNFERYGIPAKEGGKYFFTRNDGLQNQSPLYVADSLRTQPRLLIDPNAWSKDGTMALAGTALTEDARHLAFGVADAGSDWTTWKVLDVETGKELPDVVSWVKFSGASWLKDGSGFFYSRYEEPEAGKALRASNFYQQVYFHRLGTKQSEDRLVYHRPDEKEWGFAAGVTDDGRYVVMHVWKGTDTRNRFFYRDLGAFPMSAEATDTDNRIAQAEREIKRRVEELASLPEDGADATVAAKLNSIITSQRQTRAALVESAGRVSHGFVELLNDFDADYTFIGNEGPVFFFRTDLDAPRGRVIAIDITRPERSAWKEIIPQGSETLTGVSFVGGRLITSSLADAKTQVRVHRTDGTLVGPVGLPGIGTASGFGGKQDDPETFYSFTSYTSPPTIYRFDAATGESTLFRKPSVRFNPDDYETTQVFYTSKDGTRVPMFITHRKGLKLDGSAPCLLYGYGGFNIPLTPGFSVSSLVWLEMGGVYAVANLRGGGEYGEQWHKGGTKTNKQNVFDDFIAAAEHLIDRKYTSRPKLAIHGGSNGGLLVGACMVQRPDLFGAALPAVGVLDMLRFDVMGTIGHAWRSDYGSASSDDPAEFRALLAYSPYHNIRVGPCYPATMITTGDHDDRVVPAHSFKFAAALQHAQAQARDCDHPVLIRIETRAGHGAGKPTAMQIEERADMWTFLVRALNFKPTISGEPSAAPAAAAAAAD